MPVDDFSSNPTDNRPFADVLNARISRRTAIAGSLATAALVFAGADGAASAAPRLGAVRSGTAQGGFTPIPNLGGPNPTISPDYEYQVLIPWGSPLQPGGPDIDGGRPASEAEALQQIGAGHDGMWFFGRNDAGALCINHEFGRNNTVLGNDGAENLEQVRISQAVHGVSVVPIVKRKDRWEVAQNRIARRITPNTPMAFDGPAAGHPLLDTPAGNAPAGTVNNCGNGSTPWGTYLTCEENFNGYFGANGDFVPTPEQERYGFTPSGFGYRWHEHDPRWDLTNADYTNEENRFGWIVEIDPARPEDPPLKHTALGRVKHESIALTVGRGNRVVGYMGDDQRFDYVYRFVSAANWRKMRRSGVSPLAEGALYVARFDDDGTGAWMELTIENPLLAERFADQGEVVTYARVAADLLGATPMDRPEWTTVAPNGDVFCTLTNNSRRTERNAANPQAPNEDGHIIRIRDTDRHVGTSFSWDIVLLCSDTRGTDFEFTDPDGMWADPDGRLFVQTDGGQPQGNNQMVVGDPQTMEVRRLFAGVTGDEITGFAVTPDRRTMFINMQHPGNGDPEATNFPVPGAGGPEIPRDATIVITKKDGGVVGT